MEEDVTLAILPGRADMRLNLDDTNLMIIDGFTDDDYVVLSVTLLSSKEE